MSRKLLGNRGFTLVEIITFVVMGSVLLPAVVLPFIAGVRGSGKPEMVTRAVYLAHQRMEELMKYQYGEVALNPVPLTGYVAVPGNVGYEWQWEIILVDSDLRPSVVDVGYKRILVRVKDPQNDIYEIYSVVTRFPR